MQISIRFCLLVCVLQLACNAAAYGADLTPVLRTIHKKHTELPGLVGAIVDGDRVTAIGAVGVRKAGSLERFRADDLIHLGSDTKAMTATLIGKLIENKKLNFETPMAEIFVALRPEMNAEMKKITVRQLLEHTAGLPHDIDWWKIDGTKKPLREQRHMAVAEALAKAPLHPPGTKYQYSNVGYVILGAIIDRLHDKPWEEVIENQLFKPLGMASAGFGAAWHARQNRPALGAHAQRRQALASPRGQRRRDEPRRPRALHD